MNRKKNKQTKRIHINPFPNNKFLTRDLRKVDLAFLDIGRCKKSNPDGIIVEICLFVWGFTPYQRRFTYFMATDHKSVSWTIF